MPTLRILVADDHEIVRRGLRDLLESRPGWEVCGEATTGREAVEKAKELEPDLVVLDITMPELNGLEATRQILKALPRTEVLVLTIHESEQVVYEVLDAGARGYVLKSDAGRDLVAAVQALSQHKPFFTSGATETILGAYRKAGLPQGEPGVTHLPLSPREREVVQLLAEGRSSKEVATTLNISLKTVETHRANIMLKLNLHSIADLVHYAIRNRIVEA